MRVKCLGQEHNTMTRPGLEPGPFDPESGALTIMPPRLPLKTYFYKCLFFQMEMIFQQAIADTQLCGARFTDLSGNSFGVTGYDLGEIIIFSKQQQIP